MQLEWPINRPRDMDYKRSSVSQRESQVDDVATSGGDAINGAGSGRYEIYQTVAGGAVSLPLRLYAGQSQAVSHR